MFGLALGCILLVAVVASAMPVPVVGLSLAHGKYVTINIPPFMHPGSKIRIEVTWENNGAAPGYFRTCILKPNLIGDYYPEYDDGTEATAAHCSVTSYLQPKETATFVSRVFLMQSIPYEQFFLVLIVQQAHIVVTSTDEIINMTIDEEQEKIVTNPTWKEPYTQKDNNAVDQEMAELLNEVQQELETTSPEEELVYTIEVTEWGEQGLQGGPPLTFPTAPELCDYCN
jgi:hypothetical protein